MHTMCTLKPKPPLLPPITRALHAHASCAGNSTSRTQANSAQSAMQRTMNGQRAPLATFRLALPCAFTLVMLAQHTNGVVNLGALEHDNTHRLPGGCSDLPAERFEPPLMDAKLFSAFRLAKFRSVESPMDCAVRCTSEVEGCRSFSFRADDGLCQTFSQDGSNKDHIMWAPVGNTWLYSMKVGCDTSVNRGAADPGMCAS